MTEISVIIPTRDRAPLLRRALQSYANQTIAPARYEVVVVDDGSSDHTAEVCAEFDGAMPVRLLSIPPSGSSAAKNLGIFSAVGHIVLLADDDDTAARNLLAEHLRAHERWPDDQDAVLGHTSWAPELAVTPVMDFAMGDGDLLFSYRHLSDGQLLDFRFLWAGRTSLKRNLLVHHGVFDQDIGAWEDVELGFRLARRGMRIHYHRHAASYMLREVTLDELRERCQRQGRGRHVAAARHPGSELSRCCAVEAAMATWRACQGGFPERLARARELEIEVGSDWPRSRASAGREELWDLYREVFRAEEARGVAEAVERGHNGYVQHRRLFDEVVARSHEHGSN